MLKIEARELATAADVLANAAQVRERRKRLMQGRPQLRIAQDAKPEKVERAPDPKPREAMKTQATQQTVIEQIDAEALDLLTRARMPDLKEVKKVWLAAGEVFDPNVIIRATALVFGMTCEDMMGYSRARQYVHARRVAIVLMRDELEMSLGKIGRLMRGRDHTTILHSWTMLHTSSMNDEGYRNWSEQAIDAVMRMCLLVNRQVCRRMGLDDAAREAAIDALRKAPRHGFL